MLKKYPVDELEAGMVIGRTVYSDDMSVLLGEGTVLDEQRIEYLDQRGIVFVRILLPDEEEPAAAEKPAAEATPAAKTPQIDDDAAAVWTSGYRYYSENPLDLAALVISLIALGVSSAGIVIAILSPR